MEHDVVHAPDEKPSMPKAELKRLAYEFFEQKPDMDDSSIALHLDAPVHRITAYRTNWKIAQRKQKEREAAKEASEKPTPPVQVQPKASDPLPVGSISSAGRLTETEAEFEARLADIKSHSDEQIAEIRQTVEKVLETLELMATQAQNGGGQQRQQQMTFAPQMKPLRVEVPFTGVSVQISALSLLLYGVMQSTIKRASAQEGKAYDIVPLGEWVDACIDYWCKKHDINLGVTSFNRQELIISGSDNEQQERY